MTCFVVIVLQAGRVVHNEAEVVAALTSAVEVRPPLTQIGSSN